MRYAIGIDGGGTKTEAVVLAEDGRELGGRIVDSTNPHAVTFAQATRNMSELLDGLFALPQVRGMTCVAVCLGLAGVDTAEERARFVSFMERYRIERGLTFETYMNNDAQIALMATLRDDRGIIAISGTGSIVYGLTPENRKYRVGGWGHLLGDEGSGYDIGISALRAVMRSYDGMDPPTLMTEMIMEAYRFSAITELKGYVYRPDLHKGSIAKFAELCVQASVRGDEAAKRIIERAAGDLAAQAVTLIGKDPWFAACDLVTTGSIFAHSPLFAETFRKSVGAHFPEVRIHPAAREAAYGAALLAWRQWHENHPKESSS